MYIAGIFLSVDQSAPSIRRNWGAKAPAWKRTRELEGVRGRETITRDRRSDEDARWETAMKREKGRGDREEQDREGREKGWNGEGKGKERKRFAHATHGNYRRRGCRPLLVLPAWTFTGGGCLEDGVHLKERYARSGAISER